LGFSFGGFVAMAIAAALEREGERVAFVGLVDCDLRWVDPSFAPDRALRTIVASMYSLLQRETGWLGSLAREELVELGEIVLGAPPGERAEAAVAWLTARRRLPEDAPIPALKEYLSTHIARVETHLRLIPGFRPTAVLAPLFVWHARAGLSGPSQGQGLWGEYSRAGVVETTIEGSHYEMMAEPYVSELARQITDRLRAVQ
jgi:thioesterase domain-containing protein